MSTWDNLNLGNEVETMWGQVSCRRKQHDGMDWTSNHRHEVQCGNHYTTAPPQLRGHIHRHCFDKSFTCLKVKKVNILISENNENLIRI